jgi:hypothetical protein
MVRYVVQQGDCLSSIAAQHGLPDYRAIYDHPSNAEFKAARPNPNILYPGDVVFIPEKRSKVVSVGTGQSHRLEVKRAKARFRVRIQFGAPFKYEIDIHGRTSKGALDDGAIIDVPIDPADSAGKLLIWLEGAKDAAPLEFDLSLGGLDPIDTISGVQARLNNLGFDCGAVDGVCGPKTEGALRAFQRAFELEVTGQIDDPTRQELAVRHDI